MITIYRGDTPTVTVTLTNAETFEVGDTVFFTIKSYAGQADVDALVAVDSGDGGVTFVAGEATASVTIPADAFDSLTAKVDATYDWQIKRGTFVSTIDSGVARILLDVTRRTTAS